MGGMDQAHSLIYPANLALAGLHCQVRQSFARLFSDVGRLTCRFWLQAGQLARL